MCPTTFVLKCCTCKLPCELTITINNNMDDKTLEHKVTCPFKQSYDKWTVTHRYEWDWGNEDEEE